jgi:ATP-binding cassette subfamily C protein
MGREGLLEKAFFSEIDDLRESQTGQINAAERLKMWQNEIVLFFMLLGLLGSFYSNWVSPIETLLLAAVLMRFFTQTAKVTGQIQKLAASESAYYSLKDFLDHAESNNEVVHGGQQPSLDDAIVFSDVGFSYRDKRVLEHLNITIPANGITTLIGPSGSGKTTIIDLVAALLEPKHGTILVDGVSISNLDIVQWRQMIGYVPQEPFLLHDSILNNITLGDSSITQTDVEAALEKSDASSFVSELAGGINFNVGERGSRLSGGQRQRIMIARALVNRPSLLILDEATSSLDPASEQEICRTISGLKGTLTVLCASHRPMLIEAADQIIDLE